jgi:asparagine synthetase B (glutamine-hydrolysing)
MSSIRVLGPLDRNVAWDGTRLYRDDDFRAYTPVPYRLRGAATSVRPGPRDSWRILRDPLGLNKLFWACGEDGCVDMAARPRTLIDAGHSLDEISAVPRGCVVDLTADDAQPVPDSIIPGAWFSSRGTPTLGMEEAGREIRSRLERYMAALAVAYPSSPVFVCLSGGLDSSGITAIAHEHFPQAVAVSFDLIRPGKRAASQDRVIAQRLARDLDMPLLEASVSEDQLFANIDTVLVEGIDWRDFNVHAALVNAALAAAIDETSMARESATPAMVLTGDLANEFLIDYQPEQYKDMTYYELPRLRGAALRASLVRGLDTCHREVGVFAAWGLSVVQPYAVAADAYLALDAKLLGCEDSKQRLCREVFGSLLPDYVYSRPKTRAQVGDPELGGGTLAACVDRGFDGTWLRHRFARLHSVTEPSTLERFMRAGRYRTAVPSLPSEVQ